MKVYNENIIDLIVDIYRTSPINPNYPNGMDCKICEKAGIECYTDSGDGYECNTGYVKYLEQKLVERKQPTVQAIPLDKVKQAREEFISKYPKNYMGEPELGGRTCYFSLNEVLEILDKLIESEK